MADIYDGDLALRLTNDGCTADYASGQPRMDAGLETSVLVSLFSRRGWPGNYLDRNQPTRHIGSDFEDAIESRPITAGTLLQVEKVGAQALDWMVSDGIAKEVSLVASAPARNRIDVFISITKPDDTKQPFRYALNWEAGLFSGPVNVGI